MTNNFLVVNSTVTTSTLSVTNIDVSYLRGSGITLAQNGNKFVELGTDAANLTYIDFHSQDSVSVDYDTRIVSYGGNTSTIKQGRMEFLGNKFGFTGGNLGIGTTDPVTTLDVNGPISLGTRIQASVDGSNLFWTSLRGTGAETDRVAFGVKGNATTGLVDSLFLNTNSSNRMIINSGGLVGIGTTSPSNGILHIGTTESFSLRLGPAGNAGNTSAVLNGTTSEYSINFSTWQDTSTDKIGARIVGTNRAVYGANPYLVQATDLAFYVNNASGGAGNGTVNSTSEVMRIRAGGNVGIGTTNPLAKLQIDQGLGNDNNGLIITNSNYGSDQKMLLTMVNSGLNNFYSYGKIQGRTSGVADSTPICLQTEGGSVGIGSTNPASILDVAGNILLSGTTSDRVLYFLNYSPNIDGSGQGSGYTYQGATAYINIAGAISVTGRNGSVAQTYLGSNVAIQAGSIYSNDYNGTTNPLVKGGSLYLYGGNGPIGGSTNNGAGSCYHRGGDVILRGGLTNLGGVPSGGASWVASGDIRMNWVPSHTWVQGNSQPADKTALCVSGSTGYVGIGTTNPGSPLTIENSSGGYMLRINNTGSSTNFMSFDTNSTVGRLFIGMDDSNGIGLFGAGSAYGAHIGTASSTTLSLSTSNVIRMTVTTGGNIGIGITNPTSYKLHVVGDIYATANVIAMSDQRVKKDIQPVVGALDRLSALNGYTYLREEKEKREMGLIAQEVQTVFPEAVHYDKEQDRYGVNYNAMIAPLLEAIKELKAKVEELSKRVIA